MLLDQRASLTKHCWTKQWLKARRLPDLLNFVFMMYLPWNKLHSMRLMKPGECTNTFVKALMMIPIMISFWTISVWVQLCWWANGMGCSTFLTITSLWFNTNTRRCYCDAWFKARLYLSSPSRWQTCADQYAPKSWLVTSASKEPNNGSWFSFCVSTQSVPHWHWKCQTDSWEFVMYREYI